MVPETDQSGKITHRAQIFFQDQRRSQIEATDRMFAWFLAIQWLVGLAAALAIAGQVEAGASAAPAIHLPARDGVALGGATIGLPILLVLFRPGRPTTRHAIAAAQMLLGVLLIHCAGGRTEAHFHVLGSFALLASYREWRVLLTASLIYLADHLVYGLFRPRSVYGVDVLDPLQVWEHIGWVTVEVAWLIWWCRQGRRELRDLAGRRAELEVAEARIEDIADERTAIQTRLGSVEQPL